MNIALWVIQALLAALFLYIGGMKVFAYERFKKMTAKNGDSGVSHGLTTFIGISELVGGLGLILPLATGVAPILTPLAALGLGVIMILATRHHMRRKEPVTMTVVLLVLCAVVVGRGIYS
jgi:uncharacterized membrane protein YphA (DoxX/SURF4 family)